MTRSMQNGKEPLRPLTRMGFALNDRHSPTIYGQRIRFAGRWLMDSAKFLFPIILPCPAKRVSVSSVVHDSRTATCTPGKPPTVMKYHAEDTSTLNGPRWSNRFRVGRAEPDAASFGRAVSMKPPWVPTRSVPALSTCTNDTILLRRYPLNLLNPLTLLNLLNKSNQSE